MLDMADTRDRIVAAARSLFVDPGYSVITHADIALEAGIGRTTFYDYFNSKEDVLVELVESELPITGAQMLAALPEELDASEKFAELACTMVEFVATDPLGLLLHTDVPRLDPYLQRRIAAAHEELSNGFANLYAEAVEDGTFRDIDTTLAMRLVYEVIMAAGRWLKQRPDPKQDVHVAVDSTVGFLMRGLTRET